MIHLAGMMDKEGLQRCQLCNVILTDYRNTMVPEGTPPLRGWPYCAAIEFSHGNPRTSRVVQEEPDCVKQTC